MSDNWQIKKIEDLFIIRPPKDEARKKIEANELVSFVPMEDLRISQKRFIPRHRRKLREVISGYTYFANNDVLLAKITPCFENGKLGIAHNLEKGIGFGSSEFIVLRSRGQVIPEYLYYFLDREEFRVEGQKTMSGAVGHKRITKEFIGNCLLPFPESLPEQHRIVKLLDEVFANIENAKQNTGKNLQNSKELIENYIFNTFNNSNKKWKLTKLGQIAKITMGQSPNGSTYNNIGEGIPLINGPVEFGKGQLAMTHITKYTNKPTKICKRNDLILCVRGSTTGKTNIAGFDSCLGRGVASIKANSDEVNQNLLNIYIASLRNYIFKLGTGSTFPNVSLRQLENITIAFPITLSEQRTLASKLDALSAETIKLESIYTKKLADLEELKKSVLAKAFNGEL